MKNLLSLVLLLSFTSCNNDKTPTKQSEEIITAELNSTIQKQSLFVGTYTKKEGHVDGKGKGIYRLDVSGSLEEKDWSSTFTKSVNPSFLTISPDKKYLYAVNELNPDDGNSGTITAYKIDEKTKDLQLINQQKTHEFAPCHVTVDATGKLAFVTNYVGGVVCVFPIEKNGGLSEASQVIHLKGRSVTDRQTSSHPHSTTISPDNQFVFIADLGTDKITSYKIDFDNQQLIATKQAFVKVTAGSGPRHFDFNPNGKTAYVINELNSTVTVFDYNSTTGQLTAKQTISTLPEENEKTNYPADIHVHPSGKYLYVSNRGHNSIAIFEINEDGTLQLIGTEPTQGDFPRNFAIDPTGKHLWVANQNTDTVVKFEIDQKSSKLLMKNIYNIPTPVCLEFL